MKYQRGVSLSGLLGWGVVIALVVMVVTKIVPSALDYYKALKDVKAVVASMPQGSTVADVRKAYAKYVEIDQLELKPDELDISKDNGQIVISFAYEKKIPLFANVSLVIEYRGATSGSGKE